MRAQELLECLVGRNEAEWVIGISCGVVGLNVGSLDIAPPPVFILGDGARRRLREVPSLSELPEAIQGKIEYPGKFRVADNLGVVSDLASGVSEALCKWDDAESVPDGL